MRSSCTTAPSLPRNCIARVFHVWDRDPGPFGAVCKALAAEQRFLNQPDTGQPGHCSQSSWPSVEGSWVGLAQGFFSFPGCAAQFLSQLSKARLQILSSSFPCVSFRLLPGGVCAFCQEHCLGVKALLLFLPSPSQVLTEWDTSAWVPFRAKNEHPPDYVVWKTFSDSACWLGPTEGGEERFFSFPVWCLQYLINPPPKKIPE